MTNEHMENLKILEAELTLLKDYPASKISEARKRRIIEQFANEIEDESEISGNYISADFFTHHMGIGRGKFFGVIQRSLFNRVFKSFKNGRESFYSSRNPLYEGMLYIKRRELGAARIENIYMDSIIAYTYEKSIVIDLKEELDIEFYASECLSEDEADAPWLAQQESYDDARAPEPEPEVQEPNKPKTTQERIEEAMAYADSLVGLDEETRNHVRNKMVQEALGVK